MTVQHLDYTPHRIEMEVTNPVEQAYRISACAKEPWTVDFIERIPAGATFWDIGACVGSYTLIAIMRGLRTVAVEPFYESYRGLCRNLALNNKLAQCVTVCGAVGQQTGWDWLHLQDMRSGAASHVLGGDKKLFLHRQLVPVYSLDDLFRVVPQAPGPAYLKIDVDGHELPLLKGGTAVLTSDVVAAIMLEMRLEQEAEVTMVLAGYGLKLAARYDHRGDVAIGDICYGEFRRA